MEASKQRKRNEDMVMGRTVSRGWGLGRGKTLAAAAAGC